MAHLRPLPAHQAGGRNDTHIHTTLNRDAPNCDGGLPERPPGAELMWVSPSWSDLCKFWKAAQIGVGGGRQKGSAERKRARKQPCLESFRIRLLISRTRRETIQGCNERAGAELLLLLLLTQQPALLCRQQRQRERSLRGALKAGRGRETQLGILISRPHLSAALQLSLAPGGRRPRVSSSGLK